MGYARTGRAWSKSRFGDSANLQCVAIAEVVKAPQGTFHNVPSSKLTLFFLLVPLTPSPYFVIKNANYVATRFFCFYPGGNQGVSVQSASLSLHKYVQ